MALTFRNAQAIDAERIAALVNSAYRGEQSRLGWTTEADLLDGRRTDGREVRRLITRRNSIFLLGQEGPEIVASVHIEKTGDHASLSMFVVEPIHQGRGIGKRLLARAEQTVQQAWRVGKVVMHVITLRHELIAFYARCGYRRTGILHEFPVNPTMWEPKVPGLALEVLEKNIEANLP
ncbi:MAG: GNAT family N-acetyltransferase [Methylococcaceae bacterium]|nr:GNAT family N-acetyltransferase [Methylococcaceae bacterium]